MRPDKPFKHVVLASLFSISHVPDTSPGASRMAAIEANVSKDLCVQ